MRVDVVAYTIMDWDTLEFLIGESKFYRESVSSVEGSDLDRLSEFAGRVCYQAFDRARPETATNKTYLADIIRKDHTSVLEHASVSFYDQEASRSLLLELERHRHLSFSVESQRFVDQADSHPLAVIPPLFEHPEYVGQFVALSNHYANSLDLYEAAYRYARNLGVPVKQAREAARSFLPNATPVNFIVTGNLRAWRHVVNMRLDPAADREIQRFAVMVLRELRRIAPNSMQDIPDPDGEPCRGA